MTLKQLFSEVLLVESPWFIEKTDINQLENRVDIWIDFKSGSTFYYQDKELKTAGHYNVYDTKEKIYHPPNVFQYKCYLHVRVPRIELSDGKIRIIKTTWDNNKNGFIQLNTSQEETISQELIIPKEILKSFELINVKETKSYYELYLEEKKDLLPPSISLGTAILNGFYNSLSLLSFPTKGKPTYLIIKRRRWKTEDGKNHCNEYDFNFSGVKATKEFATFLKEVHGHTPDEYIHLCRINGN